MSNTETLISRMSAENVAIIERYTKHYPNSGNALMSELSIVEYWTKLTYDSITTLNNVLGCGWTPTDISKLFKY
jgi:hypothetical protein